MTTARRLTCTGLILLAAIRCVTAQNSDTAIVPFTIHVPDRVLTDLKQRLALARYPDPIAGTGWDDGTDTAYLRALMTYWRTKYDWRAQERKLNQFSHFKTTIDGLAIHFIHQRSPVPGATP